VVPHVRTERPAVCALQQLPVSLPAAGRKVRCRLLQASLRGRERTNGQRSASGGRIGPRWFPFPGTAAADGAQARRASPAAAANLENSRRCDCLADETLPSGDGIRTESDDGTTGDDLSRTDVQDDVWAGDSEASRFDGIF
jgi:hypothetical protein